MLAVLLLALARGAAAGECRLPAPLRDLPGGALVWDLADDPVYFSHFAPRTPGFEAFEAWAAPQRSLNGRQRVQALADAYAGSPLDTPELERRFKLELSGRVGRFDAATCLEMLLIGEAEARRPMERGPYEMAAVVLERPGALRVYMIPGGGAVTASLAAVEPAVARDVVAGWAVRAHLHNHPFSTDPEYFQRGGSVAPSGNDLLEYRRWRERYGLRQAWVTNGFDSYRLSAGEFDALPVDR